MAVHNYSITFKSLRSNVSYSYVLEITGGSGAFIPLKGGAQPFTTQEDDDEDQFAPVRTQSGTIRIVDDGKDANGTSLGTDWWKDLAPVNDTERPVTLKANGVVYWQGFMQAQNFGGTLYGNPQEREFPVQCCLSVLAATQVSTTQTQLCNFAYLLRYIFQSIPSHTFTAFAIQGGAHAQQWLLKRLDWNNFLTEKTDNDVEPKYNLYEILEDVCRFWGWTARTYRQTIYLTTADDTTEPNFLMLTSANLDTLAAGTAAGTVNSPYSQQTVSGDVFASVDNDDFKQRGPGKATVKADVNKSETVIQFAPNSVRKLMEESPHSWLWVQEPGQDMVGYFTTEPAIGSFDSAVLSGTSHPTDGGFCRRQIYSSADQDKPTECDMFLINHVYDGNPVISIQTKKAMSFRGGSIKLGGTVYINSQIYDNDRAQLMIRVGIGASRQTARWWYMEDISGGSTTLNRGWSASGTVEWFNAGLQGGSIVSTMYYNRRHGYFVTFDSIPVFDENDLSGLLFVDIIGLWDQEEQEYIQTFQIANFSIKFSRDSVDIPSSTSTVRAREVKKDRVTTQDYTATNNNQTHEEWNADCIFASDNNMEYGYGLLMNADGSFMETAPYTAGGQHPEQHLANRVANYWATSRRRIGGDFRADVRTAGTSGSYISDVTPQHMLTINGTKFHPVAISRNWRDDVVRLSLLEMP
jgi:hypothetical protein